MADLDRLKQALQDRYAIERQIGRGGMATVYLARDLKYNRKVALKVLRAELAESLGAERFVREIRLMASMSHPHILALLDSGEVGGFLFYAMPYVEGESLRDRLNRERQLPFDDVLEITRDVASALDYAHSQGLVHRDIKPENILFQADKAVVADFGIARAVSEAGGERLTATGIAVGTPAYMSPEQAHGDRDVDGRCDVYALGCVVYEMLGGDPPFTGSSVQAIIARKVSETPPSLRVVREKVSEPVEQVVEKALEKAPADRYRSAGVFAAEFKEAVTAPVPVVARPVEEKPARRRVTVIAATAVTAVAIAAGALWFGTRGPAIEENVTPTRIAVFPASGSNVDLGINVALLLGMNLEGAGELTVADKNRVLPAARDLGVAGLSVDSAEGLARHFGAGMFILSSAVQTGRRVTVQSALYDPSRGREAVANAEAEGTNEELSEIIDAIARGLLRGHPAGYGTWLDEMGRLSSDNWDAIKHYLDGERYWLAGLYDSAVVAYERAIAEDSTWSLAWYRRYQSGKHLNDSRLRGEMLQQAWANRAGLGERDSLVLQAERADFLTYPADQEAAANVLIRRYPEHPESWTAWGGNDHFRVWKATGSRSEARESYERGLAIDSNYVEIRHWFAFLLLAEGEFAEAENVGCIAPDSWPCRCARWLQQSPDSLVRDLWNQDWENSTYATKERAGFGRDPLGARVIAARIVDDSSLTDSDRATGHMLIAHVAAAAGQWQDSKRALEQASRTFPGTALIQHVLIATMPFLAVDSMELSALQERLSVWDGRAPGLNEVQLGNHFTPLMLPEQTRLYVDGLLAATLGENAHAMRVADSLETEASVVTADSIDFGSHRMMVPVQDRHVEELARGTATKDPLHLVRDLALEIRALAQLCEGDTTAALATLERARLVAGDMALLNLALPARPLGRYLRAELLSRVGNRDEEALKWFDSFGMFPNMEFPFLAPTHFRRGQILERLGRPDEAAEHYATFLQMWGEADERYAPVLERARNALARLQPDRARQD